MRPQADPDGPPEDKGPWDRFVELRDAALARGVEVDRRPTRGAAARPKATRRPPAGAGRDRNVFVLSLVAALTICVVFLVVVALTG